VCRSHTKQGVLRVSCPSTGKGIAATFPVVLLPPTRNREVNGRSWRLREETNCFGTNTPSDIIKGRIPSVKRQLAIAQLAISPVTAGELRCVMDSHAEVKPYNCRR
jgi:hypothetical protein